MTFLDRQKLRGRALLFLVTRGSRRFLARPRLVQIEVTNRCDLACRTCTRGKLPSLGDMRFEDFTRVVDSFDRIDTLWLSGQGEPLLHPDLPRMIRYCSDRGIRGTILHTNAMQLDGQKIEALADCGLGELRVSVDGGAAAEVEYLRDGSDLATILANTAAFTARSSSPAAFYVLLNRMSHASVPLLPALAARAGVRRIYAVETVPFRDASQEREVYDRREYQFASLPPEERKRTLSALRRAGRAHGVKISVDLKWMRVRCQEPMRKIYIDRRGNVTPCCRIHHEVMVGNLLREGLDAVWYGAALARWRRALGHRPDHPRICVERCNLGIGRNR